MMTDNALHRLRSAQGVVGLADKHAPDRLEAACAKALAAGDPSYRTIKEILVAGLEDLPADRPTGDGGAAVFQTPRPVQRRVRRHQRRHQDAA
jgi:hypothetical protein